MIGTLSKCTKLTFLLLCILHINAYAEVVRPDRVKTDSIIEKLEVTKNTAFSELSVGNTQIASKHYKDAIHLHKKIADSDYRSEEVIDIKEELDTLKLKIQESYRSKKQAKRDSSNIDLAFRHINRAQKLIASEKILSVQHQLNLATSAYKKVSKTGLTHPKAIKASIEISDIKEHIRRYNLQKIDNSKKIRDFEAKRAIFEQFINQYPAISAFIEYLDKPATKDDFASIPAILENYQKLEFAEHHLIQEYGNYLDIKTTGKTTPRTVHHVLSNKAKLRDKFLLESTNDYLTSKAKTLKKVYENLNSSGKIDDKYLAQLFGSSKDQPFPDLAQVLENYSQTSLSPPIKEIDFLNQYKKKLAIGILDKMITKEEVTLYSLGSNAKTIELADQFCTNDAGGNLVKFYEHGDYQGHIEKNSSDYPIYRFNNGVILCQVSGEPFVRLYNVNIIRDFNGVGYDQPSSLQIDRKVTPVRIESPIESANLDLKDHCKSPSA